MPFVLLLALFQFLYGAIKREPQKYFVPDQKNFNSCMVRLKVFYLEYHEAKIEYFNSCMVRLKGDAGPQLFEHSSYFNSCMVRLKVQTSPYLTNATAISIPVWCD